MFIVTIYVTKRFEYSHRGIYMYIYRLKFFDPWLLALQTLWASDVRDPQMCTQVLTSNKNGTLYILYICIYVYTYII